MSKPTPGPYEIHDSVTKFSVGVSSPSRRRTCIATFWRDTGDDKKEQAEANARAWVDGIAAMEKLGRIRAALSRPVDATMKLVEIDSIVAEAKP